MRDEHWYEDETGSLVRPYTVTRGRTRPPARHAIDLMSRVTAVAPREPTDPVEPTGPNEPTGPHKAVAPNEPTAPHEAVAPDEPTGPHKAVAPELAVVPDLPVGPTPLPAPARAVAPDLPHAPAALLDLIRRGPRPVVELAVDADLPLTVVRVLLGDLADAGLIRIDPPRPASVAGTAAPELLQEIVNRLKEL
ncbi:DUF742 domain-containing protein [Streptomyces sp. SID2955]|nr:DUF742 domain-containing protein [Streptomyces sp. SID2955]